MTSSSEPFGLTGATASNSAASPTRSRVDSWTSTSSGGEFCSMTVDVSTGGPEEHVLAALRRAERDLAGGDAGADDEADAVAGIELVVEGRERALRFRGRLEGAERVVVVPERQAEHRDDRVADDLLDRAAVRLEHRAHDVEVAVQDLAQRLRVEPLAERRRALEVRGDEGDDAADLARGLVLEERRAAHPAQAGVGRIRLAARPAGLLVHGGQSSGGCRPLRGPVRASGQALRAGRAARAPAAQVAQRLLVGPGEARTRSVVDVRPRRSFELRVDQRVAARAAPAAPGATPSAPRAGRSASSATTFAVRALPVSAAISPKKSPGPIDDSAR